MAHTMTASAEPIPILLLKTKSCPTDAYQDLFTTATAFNTHFSPVFVPVLQHCLQEPGLGKTRSLLQNQRISSREDSQYGGVVFTSQRAVEAFAKLVEDGHGDASWPHLQDVPIYSVGPATTRALSAISQSPKPLQIFGEHTGTGEALAHFMLDHYSAWYPNRNPLPPLLFLVGETRRDIIPKTLMSKDLPASRSIEVDETVVYGTGEMASFPSDFDTVLKETISRPERWIVVFSPTGCDSMLRGLGLLNPATGKANKEAARDGRTFIATIGPTTQSYLIYTFGIEPDVCAEKPSPEGILEAIVKFKSRRS